MVQPVQPAFTFDVPLRPWTRDGLWRAQDGGIMRLVRADGELTAVRVRAGSGGLVEFAALTADRPRAEKVIGQARWMLGVDDDLAGAHRTLRTDRYLGSLMRAWPGLRVRRRPPLEALVWAVCEQLIEYEQAAQIQRELTRRLGTRDEMTGLRISPSAHRLADSAPAELEACGLSTSRALLVRRLAAQVACGRLDLHGPADALYRRLRAEPGVGSWTVAMFALYGRGDLAACPSGDVNLMKIVGQITSGRPRARASEEQVHAFMTGRYGPYAGLAAVYLMARRSRRAGPGLGGRPVTRARRPPTR